MVMTRMLKGAAFSWDLDHDYDCIICVGLIPFYVLDGLERNMPLDYSKGVKTRSEGD
jgi:hypothetical protein